MLVMRGLVRTPQILASMGMGSSSDPPPSVGGSNTATSGKSEKAVTATTTHWELQSFQRGGMTPLEALTTATVNPAKHLGMFDDIGTLEVGKLADMVVVDGDPLEDIREAENVEHVIQGGRVYEAKTMNEVVTGDRKRGLYPWERSGE